MKAAPPKPCFFSRGFCCEMMGRMCLWVLSYRLRVVIITLCCYFVHRRAAAHGILSNLIVDGRHCTVHAALCVLYGRVRVGRAGVLWEGVSRVPRSLRASRRPRPVMYITPVGRCGRRDLHNAPVTASGAVAGLLSWRRSPLRIVQPLITADCE